MFCSHGTNLTAGKSRPLAVQSAVWTKWQVKFFSRPGAVCERSLSFRAIFARPWNENAETKQKQLTNETRAIWLVCRTDTNTHGFWLVKRTLRWKNFIPEELSRNQSIFRFDVILQHDWPIEQCLLHIKVFFGEKTKRPCFDLFIHWLIKQITTNYRNHFSRLYENRSIKNWTISVPLFTPCNIKGVFLSANPKTDFWS